MKNAICLLLFTIAVFAFEELYAQVPCTNIAAWSNAQPYSTTGTQVVYNNNLYQSKWWANPSDVPGNANGPWQFMGNCQSGTSAPLPTSFSVSGWASSGTAIYTLNSGNVGIGNPNPSQKLDVYGNIQITGAGNALRFADGTQLSSASEAGLWVAKGDTAAFSGNAKITKTLKIGQNSLYLTSQPNNGTLVNEIYADGGPLILQNSVNQRVDIGTTDNTNLAGLNAYSQNTKVLANGHISLLGWDNTANTTVDNWFRTDRMLMQNIQDLDANHWNRGLISNNLIWDSGLNNYSVLNNTNGQNDFAAIRFDNFGSIGIYTAPQNGNYQSISTAQLDNYKRITISNTGKVGIGNTNPFTDLEVSKSVDPSFRVSAPVNGGVASGGISVASSNGSYNSISTPGDVIFGAGCGGTEDLIIGVADSRNGSIRFTTNGGYGCGVAPDLERLTILGNGNVGIGINNPTNKFQVKGNTLLDGDLKVTGAFNFNDNSSFTFANSYLTYSGGFNVQNTLKVGTGSLYLNGAQSTPINGSSPSKNEIFTGGTTDLYLQNQGSSGKTIINPTSGKVLIGTTDDPILGGNYSGNTFSQTKVFIDGHVSLRAWDGKPINNFFRTDKIVMQNTQDASASHWHRGMIANNLLWQPDFDGYIAQDPGTVYGGYADDFAVMRFNDGGGISFYTAPKTEVRSSSRPGIGVRTLSPNDLENYLSMQITYDGNVGIGLNQPLSKLHVNGNIASSGVDFILGLNDGRVNASGNNPSSLRALSHTNWRTTEKNELIINVDGDYAGGTIVDGKGLFVSGNLGIGSYSPSEKLVVSGNVKVTGKIATTEVCVNTGATWCDYVFDKSYNLPSLKEVASFIEKNKHLPGIPPAKEIEKDGISVSKMLTMQMEKIEQLTLYILEQEKKIQELQKAVLKK